MKKRLLITLTFPPDMGGMQSFAHQRCLRAGDEPVVFAPWHTDSAEFDAIQPFPILRWRPFLGNVPGLKRIGQLLQPLLLALRLGLRRDFVELSRDAQSSRSGQARQLLQQGGFDAVECWQPLPLGLTAWLLKRIYRLPVIIWSHGSDLLRVQRIPGGMAVLRWTLSQADRLIANSMATQLQMERLGQDPARIRVIHPPVEHERFHPNVDPTPIGVRHAIGGAPTILTVARLVEKKGIDMVLRALPSILCAVPEVRYLIVGDGPLRLQLQALARELGVASHVVFVGVVEHNSADLPRYYSACDVYVMPSRSVPGHGEIESFGISYLEAGACGKPVIGGKGGGTSEAIEDGVTGLLVDPLDVNEIADTIVEVLKDEELARRLGENGRKRAIRQPDWDLLKLPSHG
ncbi:MAG: glycosyltransferase family 4 protein [Anaerolineales bacterium]|nr:glycosyltransferase family 4 protein [Anaerolineales bacterium]